MKRSKAYYRGCLIGGAIGDALAYPRKSMSPAALEDRIGTEGFRELITSDQEPKALVSDDTQLTVFTADGIIWADKRAREKGVYAYIPSIFYGYQKWYYTQTGHFADPEYEFLRDSEVLNWEDLFARRIPNSAALDALKLSTNGKHGTFTNRPNTLKSYGPIVRTAPLGMYFAENPGLAYKTGCQQAALTHGQPEVWYCTGFVSALFVYLFNDKTPAEAALDALTDLRADEDASEVAAVVKKVMDEAAKNNRLARTILSEKQDEAEKQIKKMDEAFYVEIREPQSCVGTLSIGLYAALRYPDNYEKAVLSAANAKAEANGAASLAGQIIGANVGSLEIPYNWIRKVELSDLLVFQADDILKRTL